MKRLAAMGAVIAALVAVPVATAEIHPEYWPALTALSSRIAGHPANTYCESTTEWPTDPIVVLLSATIDPDGYTLLYDPPYTALTYSVLSPLDCGGIVRLIADPNEQLLQGKYPLEARALVVTIHESIHQRGIHDEAMTQCLAMKQVSEVAASLNVNAENVQRLLAAAQAYDATLPPQYHGATC